MLTEIYPAPIRGQAMSIAVAAQWIANLLVSATFPLLLGNDTLNASWQHGFPFWLYGGFGLVAAFVVMRYVPETRGVDSEALASLWKREEARVMPQRSHPHRVEPASRKRAHVSIRRCGETRVPRHRVPPGRAGGCGCARACASVLRERRQSGLHAHGVDAAFILDGMWLEPVRARAQLRAVALRAPFIDANAIVDDGELPAWRVAIVRRCRGDPGTGA